MHYFVIKILQFSFHLYRSFVLFPCCHITFQWLVRLLTNEKFVVVSQLCGLIWHPFVSIVLGSIDSRNCYHSLLASPLFGSHTRFILGTSLKTQDFGRELRESSRWQTLGNNLPFCLLKRKLWKILKRLYVLEHPTSRSFP